MTTHPRDFWTLRRLQLRREVSETEVGRLSPRFQPIGRLLYETEGDRNAPIEAFLADQNDHEQIVRALAASNPDGPMPNDGDESGGDSPPDPEPEVELWPSPPAPEAYHGVLGSIVQAIAPHTEADPMAILGQLIVMIGNLLGRAPYFSVEADRHHANEFLSLVGLSGKGKKGTSYGWALDISKMVDPDWAAQRIVSGLSSGEGLIWALRDANEKDEGVADKRLLVVESELSNVMRVMKREGNTVSVILRNAWDGLTLRSLTSGRGKLGPPVVATAPHLSIIGHITRDELIGQLSRVDAANGFFNRFIWLAVRRSKLLPRGGGKVELRDQATDLRKAVDFARRQAEIPLSADAGTVWDAEYERLSSPPPGLLGAVLSRAEPHVRRLAMIYALADCSAEVCPAHLRAAIALWDYAERSARFIFGNSLGDPLAEAILGAIRLRPGLSRTDITRDVLGGNQKREQVTMALAKLAEFGLAHRKKDTAGRHSVERWYPGREGAGSIQ